MNASETINLVKEQTDSVILFHSSTGKDSICLLDLLAPHFKRVVCVYMYIIKDLQSVNRYIEWAKARYSNVEFVQVAHYATASYIKYGHLGCEINPKQRLYTLANITDIVREKLGLEWVFFGMKKSDGLNRRCMLNTKEYENGINRKTKKAYPLADYKNSDILRYIHEKNLITPPDYSSGIFQTKASSGESLSLPWLYYLRENFPNDLNKVINFYPHCANILSEFDNFMAQNQDVSNDIQE